MPTTEANQYEVKDNQGTRGKVTRVAVGVILRDEPNSNVTQVCISLRPKHLHKGGLWEFPGGKIEQGEDVGSALVRELKEELGIKVRSFIPMRQILWDYKEKTVLLEVIKVTDFDGDVSGLEGQQVEWVTIEQLHDYQFPEANQAIIDGLLNF